MSAAQIARLRAGGSPIPAKWAFLTPWIRALRRNALLTPPEPGELSVDVTLHCWLCQAMTKIQKFTACDIVVGFPAVRDRQKAQRLREAIDLLNELANVDCVAFTDVLGDCILGNDEWLEYHGSYEGIKMAPKWVCRLKGKLSFHDAAVKQSPVTWETLLGCPDDPWEYSAEFREAAMKLEAMEKPVHRNLKNLMLSTRWHSHEPSIPMLGWHREPNDAWGESIPKTILDETIRRPSEEHFVREMRHRWKGVVPVIAQVAAARNGLDVFDAWDRSRQPQQSFSNGSILASNFALPYARVVTVALSYSGIANLTITLEDGRVPRHQWAPMVENEGVLFSMLVCGRAMCGPLVRHGSYPNLKLLYGWTSDVTFAAITSALVEARKVESVVFQPSENEERDTPPVNHVQWRWLAFALFSKASNDSISRLEMSKFCLTKQDVLAVAAVMKAGYPEPMARRVGVERPPEYGYVDVQRGTVLRLSNLPGRNRTTIELSHDRRCRALYDPSTMGGSINVVVPGYGVCSMKRGRDGVNEFVRDPPSGPPLRADRAGGIEQLEMLFLTPESGTVLTTMLALIGGGIRDLLIAESPDAPITVELGALAAACPRLERLRITCSGITLANRAGLRHWPIEDLSLLVNKEIPGLAECLDDGQTFRQLFMLEQVVRSDADLSAEYWDALEAHDGEYIPEVEEDLSPEQMAALISVMESVAGKRLSSGKTQHASLTDPKVTALIFDMAAFPLVRTVHITTSD